MISTYAPTTPKFKLRPYQEKALAGIFEEFSEHQATLAVQATGTGKTVLAASVMKDLTHGRIKFLCHRDTLVYQAKRTIEAVTGEMVEVEMGDQWADTSKDYKARIIVSTVQTQMAGQKGAGRKSRFDPKEFILLVVDEAHHYVSHKWRLVVEYYKQNPALNVLGLTATPDRSDEKALKNIFDSVAHIFEIRDAVDDGWLVPIKVRPFRIESMDLSNVKVAAGDLQAKELDAVMRYEQTMHKIAHGLYEKAAGRRTLVYCVTVAHAERMAEILNRWEPACARAISQSTPKEERKQIYKAFREGQFNFLVNVMLATEGYDEPAVEVIANLRPTKSRALFCQICGRGTRTLTGTLDGLDAQDAQVRKDAIANSDKPHLEIFDFHGHSGRHRLVTPSDILGTNQSEEVLARSIDDIHRSTEDYLLDVEEQLTEAEKEVEKERKQKLREEKERQQQAEFKKRQAIKVQTKYHSHIKDIFDVLETAQWQPRGWDTDVPCSDKQDKAIAKFTKGKLQPHTLGMTKRQANQVLGNLISRAKKRLCTFNQAKVLQRFGYDTTYMKMTEASKIMDKLAANNWRKV